MRQLQLQKPNMSGPDVADWQTFLKNQGVYQSRVDSEFGPKSDQATRSYQNNVGLTPHGVVDSTTMAKAVEDGYQSSTGANISGIDTRTACSPFAGDISAVGIKFACRYYSHSTSKTLTPFEAKDLSDAGVNIVSVFQDSNNSADLFSAAIGNTHAAKALELAAAIGQPAGTAIYFAVDFDPLASDVQGAISDYFIAVNSVFASAPTHYAVGVYGSGLTCRLIRDAGLAKFTWLTESIGFQEYSSFRPEADIVQLAPERELAAGLSVDDNIAQSADFGSFRVGQAQLTTNT